MTFAFCGGSGLGIYGEIARVCLLPFFSLLAAPVSSTVTNSAVGRGAHPVGSFSDLVVLDVIPKVRPMNVLTVPNFD